MVTREDPFDDSVLEDDRRVVWLDLLKRGSVSKRSIMIHLPESQSGFVKVRIRWSNIGKDDSRPALGDVFPICG